MSDFTNPNSSSSGFGGLGVSSSSAAAAAAFPGIGQEHALASWSKKRKRPDVELDEQTLNKCTFTPSGNIPKALVVEDSKSTCLLFAKVIAGLGWQTVSAQDGACALQLLASEVYDLVLLDVQLPLLSG